MKPIISIRRLPAAAATLVATTMVVTANPIAHFKLDESPASDASTIVDSSGNGNDGTLTTGDGSADKSVPGAFPGSTAIDFDGVDDQISASIAGLSTGTKVRTMSAWFNSDVADTSSNMVCGYGNGTVAGGLFGMSFEAHPNADPGNLAMVYRHGSGNRVYQDAALATETWFHVVAVVPEGSDQTNDVLVYINGNPIGTGIQGNGNVRNLATVASSFGIGHNGSGGDIYDGKVDDVQLYDRVLTEEQIKSLYDNPGSIIDLPPVIVSFTADQYFIPGGGAVSLSWEVSGADTLTIDQGVGDVSGAGSVVASVDVPTTYTLTASNGQGSATATLTVRTQPGLIARYSLDESPAEDGTVIADSSGNGYDGVLTTNEGSFNVSVPGAFPGSTAIDFDGFDDAIVAMIDEIPSGNASRTITAWCKADVVDVDESTIFQFGNSTLPGGQFGISFEDHNATDTTSLEMVFRHGFGNRVFGEPTLAIDSWCHVAAVVPYGATQTDDVLVYVNGVEVAGVQGNGELQTLQTLISDFAIGQNPNVAGENFDGSIDDVQVYAGAATAEQIAFLYANPGSTVELTLPVTLAVTGFGPDPAAVADWQVSFTGAPESDFLIKSSADLDFSAGATVTPVDAAVGALAGDIITTDLSGNATVRFNSSAATNFFRVETAP